MRKMTGRTTIAFGTVLLLGTVFYGNSAQATPISCTSTITLAGGNGNVATSSLTSGVCVQTADALFGDFYIGQLPTGGRAAFNVTNFGTPSVGYHGISFNANFAAGNTYRSGYSVEVSSGPNLFKSMNTDFTQNNGTSSVTTFTNQAYTGSIDWTKVGSVGSGPDSIGFGTGYNMLTVTNVLTDNGSVSAIANNAIENGPVLIGVPEPASMAMLASGVLGVVAFRRRRQAARASA